MSSKRNILNKADILIIILIFFASAIFYLLNYGNYGKATAEIIYDGKVIETISLDTERTFSFAQNQNVIFTVHNKAICFSSSDCPDKICVNSGFLAQKGQFAACVPNKFAVRVY